MNTRPLPLQSALSFCTFKNGVGAKLLIEEEMQNLLTFGFVLKLQPFIHQLNPFALDLEEDQH